jgi:uncharacterized protein
MNSAPRQYRQALEEYIRAQAKPLDKFSHQPRLYRLAVALAEGQSFDDDVVHAAAWLHDLGVFIGHRPEDLQALATWDHVTYVTREAPGLLERFGCPTAKIPAVLEAIRTHMPQCEPTTFEGVLLRDADILEQLGAVSVLRTVSKVGRDTRFILFSDALRTLHQNLEKLPGMLRLESARRLAEPRIQTLKNFLKSAESESCGVDW